MDEILSYIIAIAGGGVGVLGLCLIVLKVWVSGAFKKAMADKAERDEYLMQSVQLELEYKQKVGRTLFWIIKGIERYKAANPEQTHWNGDLAAAHKEFLDVEKRMKKLDNEQLSRLRSKK